MSDITGMGAVDLAAAIRRRRFSVRECVTAFLARIAADNPTYNAIVSLREDADILAEADTRDAVLARGEPADLGPLFGLPTAVKDLVPVAGLPCTMGSPIFADTVADSDEILAERLRAAGAIIIGKTNTPEFGLGSHTFNKVFGATGNAYDPSKSAGGSSGGAAVALARRMLPIADGSDVGGSLRNPAGWNNVIGMRPSYGLVPSWPADDAYFQQLSVAGPMGRSVADVALLLGVLAGHDPRAPLSRELPQDWPRLAMAAARGSDAAIGRRIGWLADLGGHLPFEEGILDTTARALATFEEVGAVIEPATIAFDLEVLWHAFAVLRATNAGASFQRFYEDPAKRDLLKPEAQFEVELAQSLTALDVARAARVRTAWYHTMRGLFERFDALVLPTAQVTPFPIELDWPKTIAGRTMDTYHRWFEVCSYATLAGCPVVNLPAGFVGTGGTRLPIGLQLIGAPRGDLALLALASHYEAACPHLAESPV